MRKQILTIVLVLAASATTGAMASGHKRGSGHHLKSFHAAGVHGVGLRQRGRLAGVRSSASWRESDRGGYVDLGPFGMMAACGLYRTKHGYCGPGYSVSAWTY